MRFNEQAVQPKKKQKEDKPVRELTRPGRYSQSDLEGTKKINTGRGSF